MALPPIVSADIIDLSCDQPTPGDTFLVDTNVWLWTTYSKASIAARAYQSRMYPSYLNRAIAAGASVVRCGLSLSELANVIEKMEFDVYCQTSGMVQRKAFRHQPAERAQVVAEIQTAWTQVEALSQPIVATVDQQGTNAALALLQGSAIDAYDSFLVNSAKSEKIVQILTDDGDFATVPGVRVFTGNRALVQLARRQGRLITR